MAENKQTYGLSLNRNNPSDVPLMDWLDGMERGGTAQAIRAGLTIQKDIEAGTSEVVAVGTIASLEAHIAELEHALRVQSMTSAESPAPAPIITESGLAAAISKGIVDGLKQSGLAIAVHTNGNGHHATPEPEAPPHDLCPMCPPDDQQPIAPGKQYCAACDKLAGQFVSLSFDEFG